MLGAIPGSRGSNILGYRGERPAIPKDPAEYRIFMLGGSTVLLGKPPISNWLEHEFRISGYPKVSVYNYGVLSSVSGMELARIVYEISDLQPDLIIMYNGGNDLIVPWESDPRPGYPFNFLVLENNPLVENTPETYPAFALFAYGSNLCRYFLHDYFIEHFVHLDALRNQFQWKSDPWRDKIANNYVSNVVKAGKISVTFGAEFIVFFQPMVFFKLHLSPEERWRVEGPNAEYAEYARDMRRRMLGKLSDAAKTSTLNWKDLSQIYDHHDDKVFSDVIHTTDIAKRIVARAIYRRILEVDARQLEPYRTKG